MTTTLLPAVIDALVTVATAAVAPVPVYDGEHVAEEPGPFLMVGVEDLESSTSPLSASAEQSWASVGAKSRDESGRVVCVAYCDDGSARMKAARDGVFDIADRLEQGLRADPYLGGVTGLLWAEYGGSIQLTQAQYQGGAVAMLAFQVNYRARI